MLTLEEAACFPFLQESRAHLQSLDLDFSRNDPRHAIILDLAKKRLIRLVSPELEDHTKVPEPWLELATFHASFMILKFSRNTDMKLLFAKTEARHAAIRFLSQTNSSLKIKVAREAFSQKVTFCKLALGARIYTMRIPIWDYLTGLREQNLKPLKLVNKPVHNGFVHLQDQELALLVAAGVEEIIKTKITLENALEPPQILLPLISWVNSQMPANQDSFVTDKYWQKKITMVKRLRKQAIESRYHYIEKLLQKPVVDGRHRLVWLVITPYFVNVKNLPVEDAIRATVEYLKKCGWAGSHLGKLARYHSQRAKRLGLKPPRLGTLAKRDPHLYAIVLAAQT